MRKPGLSLAWHWCWAERPCLPRRSLCSPWGAQEAGPNPTSTHLPGSWSWLQESYSSLCLFAGQAVCLCGTIQQISAFIELTRWFRDRAIELFSCSEWFILASPALLCFVTSEIWTPLFCALYWFQSPTISDYASVCTHCVFSQHMVEKCFLCTRLLIPYLRKCGKAVQLMSPEINLEGKGEAGLATVIILPGWFQSPWTWAVIIMLGVKDTSFKWSQGGRQ